jgi:hypothetical protein
MGSNFIFGYLPYYSLLYTLCNGRRLGRPSLLRHQRRIQL